MSWFRFAALVFAVWAATFSFFPRFTNEFAGVGYVTSRHAEDWTQLVGLLSLGFAVLLEGAHRSSDPAARRLAARGVFAAVLPCALLMAYWQIIPDGRWFRLDIANVALLFLMSYGMFRMGALGSQVRT